MKTLRIFFFLSALIIPLIIGGCSNTKKDKQKKEPNVIIPLTKHWEKAVPIQKIPKGLKTLSSKECGSCHKDFYAEWKRANHSKAWEDLQFQSEWKKDKKLWVCINCHTPSQNQQKFIVIGKLNGDYFKPVKKPNPLFDPALQKESITCAKILGEAPKTSVTAILTNIYEVLKNLLIFLLKLHQIYANEYSYAAFILFFHVAHYCSV